MSNDGASGKAPAKSVSPTDETASRLRKRSVTIRGHRTSFSLEEAFHSELEMIARVRSMPLAALVAEIDEERPRGSNLSSALRLHVLAHLKAQRERPE